MIETVLARWKQHLRGELAGGLDALLHDDVVFYSPIVYTPQRGKAITKRYLEAAGQTLPGDADAGKPSAAAGGEAPGGGGFRANLSTGTALGLFQYSSKDALTSRTIGPASTRSRSAKLE